MVQTHCRHFLLWQFCIMVKLSPYWRSSQLIYILLQMFNLLLLREKHFPELTELPRTHNWTMTNAFTRSNSPECARQKTYLETTASVRFVFFLITPPGGEKEKTLLIKSWVMSQLMKRGVILIVPCFRKRTQQMQKMHLRSMAQTLLCFPAENRNQQLQLCISIIRSCQQVRDVWVVGSFISASHTLH